VTSVRISESQFHPRLPHPQQECGPFQLTFDILFSDPAVYRSVKSSRRHVQGAFGDPDLHGGQQHAPLMAVEIPN